MTDLLAKFKHQLTLNKYNYGVLSEIILSDSFIKVYNYNIELYVLFENINTKTLNKLLHLRKINYKLIGTMFRLAIATDFDIEILKKYSIVEQQYIIKKIFNSNRLYLYNMSLGLCTYVISMYGYNVHKWRYIYNQYLMNPKIQYDYLYLIHEHIMNLLYAGSLRTTWINACIIL